MSDMLEKWNCLGKRAVKYEENEGETISREYVRSTLGGKDMVAGLDGLVSQERRGS